MSLALDLRFTDPAAPLFIDVEGDHAETLFVISTSQVHGAAPGAPRQHYPQDSSSRKRGREETPQKTRNTKPMKAVQSVEGRLLQTPRTGTAERSPIPLTQAPAQLSQIDPPPFVPNMTPELPPVQMKEPLFLPSLSQLSVVDEAAVRATRLGLENMHADEPTHSLRDEGEEVAFGVASQDPHYHDTANGNPDSLEIEEAAEIPPSQRLSPKASSVSYFDVLMLSTVLFCRCSMLFSKIETLHTGGHWMDVQPIPISSRVIPRQPVADISRALLSFLSSVESIDKPSGSETWLGSIDGHGSYRLNVKSVTYARGIETTGLIQAHSVKGASSSGAFLNDVYVQTSL